MKSSTYASLVTMVFLQHKNDISKSIESVIRSADLLGKQLELHNDLSHMTKYRVVSDLLQSFILTAQKTNKNKKLRLSQKIIHLYSEK